MASNDSDQGEAPKDVTNAEVQAAVDKLLNEITNTFSKVSAEITTKLTEMSNRLDQLEASVMADKPKGNDPPNPA